MTRYCKCHSRCRHLLPSGDPLLPPEKLADLEERLESSIGLLLDAADSFDSASLQFNPECGLHGERAVSNSECICRGARLTAVEFVQELHSWMRTSGRYQKPAGRPNTARKHDPRMSLAVAS